MTFRTDSKGMRDEIPKQGHLHMWIWSHGKLRYVCSVCYKLEANCLYCSKRIGVPETAYRHFCSTLCETKQDELEAKFTKARKRAHR